MGYRLSASAEQDLIGIYVNGCASFGSARADAYHDTLKSTFELLAEFPQLARQREEFNPAVRIHTCGSHVVIYSVDEAGDVLIVRVRHGREDWTKDPAGEP